MKILSGTELVGYIKERQAKQVRALRQSWRVIPKLAIVYTGNNPVISTYMRLKKEYGDDILIDVDIHNPTDVELIAKIHELNHDETIHGIIVQLPLGDKTMTEEVLKSVAPEKDVDGLGSDEFFTPATAMAIDWLIAGYNVELYGKKIAIIGNGRLVGAPLGKLWKGANLDVEIYNSKTVDLAGAVQASDVIVTATGVPSLIKNDMIKYGAVLVDAGTASENGKIVGDVSEEIRLRQDISITPIRGGVGPLTVAALFDNVIRAARKIADKKGQQDI
jgi:methylenetetrahydrofolate dehydrogenase (NADP+)/methenyltetrahydrofolate cyclohydrolase